MTKKILMILTAAIFAGNIYAQNEKLRVAVIGINSIYLGG
jgi:hypothetical protein